MKTILVPVDLSPVTKQVIADAAVLARAFRPARVVLLHVTKPVAVIADYTASRERIDELTALSAAAAAKELAVLQGTLQRTDLTVDVVSVTGSPVPLIVEHAKRLRADYVVIGSHGHSAFYDLLVGSTAGGIMKRAACPVVVVPAGRSGPKRSVRRK